MKKLVIIIAIAAASCNSQVKTERDHSQHTETSKDKTETLTLNNGSKWKADSATIQHVNEMQLLIKDSLYADPASRAKLGSEIKSRIDLLIKDCRMEGPDHDVLHTWLKKVLKDLKELKEEDEDFKEARSDLQKSIDSFYDLFE